MWLGGLGFRFQSRTKPLSCPPSLSRNHHESSGGGSFGLEGTRVWLFGPGIVPFEKRVQWVQCLGGETGTSTQESWVLGSEIEISTYAGHLQPKP